MSRPCPGQVASGPYGTDRSSRSAYVDDTQEPSREVDDQQFGVAVLVEVQVEFWVVAGIVDAFDVGAEAVDAEVDFEVQLPGGDRDVRGEHCGPGLE